MNTKTLNVFALLLLIGAAACSQATINKLELIKNNEFRSSLVGQTVIDTVQLQLASGGSLDAIIRLLQELKTDLQSQQTSANQERDEKNNKWNTQIDQYNKTIASLIQKIAEIERDISRSHKQIEETQRNIKINNQQIALVNSKLADLTNARRADSNATEARVHRQEEMLKAINYLIVELNKLLVSGSFVQLGQIKAKLAQLVKQNPIDALVQLTMTFEPESVQFAIKKLTQIRDALVESLKDEAEQEAAAKAQYLALKQEMESFQKTAHAELDKNTQTLADLQTLLAKQEKDLAETQDLLKLNQKLLGETQQAQANYNATWASEKAQRESEEATLDKVVEILQGGSNQINGAEAHHFTAKLSA